MIKQTFSQNSAFKINDQSANNMPPENTIEAGIDRQNSELDAEVSAWAAKRRDQMLRLRQQHIQNEHIVAEENITPLASRSNLDASTSIAKGNDERATNHSKAIPDLVKARFIQADNKYYFPDKTHAFDDRGTKLATRSENQEVVRSIVAIAQTRGWDRVTVRGTEDFRRVAWLEASLSGIEVSGYKPSKVEKAHLETRLARNGQENSIEQGADRQQSQGRKSVTARERISDENDKEWVGSLDKAKAFVNDDRAAVVKKYSDLAPAYGTVSAARKFAEKQFPDNKKDQARFVAVAQQIIAEKIAHGEPVPAPKIRETKIQERPKQQSKSQERDTPSTPSQKQQVADHDRTR